MRRMPLLVAFLAALLVSCSAHCELGTTPPDRDPDQDMPPMPPPTVTL